MKTIIKFMCLFIIVGLVASCSNANETIDETRDLNIDPVNSIGEIHINQITLPTLILKKSGCLLSKANKF